MIVAKGRTGPLGYAVTNIVHQRAYSGVHEVTFKGDEKPIERPVAALVDPYLQERAKNTLEENKRYRNRKLDRNYLLAGLVKCAVCGYACIGHSVTARGKKHHYYACIDGRTEKLPKGPPTALPTLTPDGWRISSGTTSSAFWRTLARFWTL